MLRPPSPARCLLLLGFISCVLLFSLSSRYDLLDSHTAAKRLGSRQLPSGGAASIDTGLPANSSPSSPPVGPSSPPPSPPTTSPPTSPTPASSDPASPPPQQSSDPAPASTPSDTTPPPASSNSDPAPASSAPANTPSNTPSPTPVTSASLSVGADGETQTILYTITKGVDSASPSPSHSAAADDGSASSKSGKSTIVGLSVAGGIALIGLGVFLYWKFGRKRGHEDFDDNEAIQWPELNTHGDDTSKFPSNRSAGFETNSEVNLTRPDSRAGSLAPSAAASAVDLYAPNQDPYAVPPLPHLNPNQPYRDDPGPGYYDPYAGPAPQTYSDTPDQVGGAESIPMTQINRARSPGPQAAYDAGVAGRRSPGPQAAYDLAAGRQSPGPQAAYGAAPGYAEGGRMSPGPGVALSGRASPGPGIALGGRASPGPQAAYGAYSQYGNGRQSPGPQAAYGH